VVEDFIDAAHIAAEAFGRDAQNVSERERFHLFGFRIATPHVRASARKRRKKPPTRAVGKTPAEARACSVFCLFGEFFMFAVSVAAWKGLSFLGKESNYFF
jgi:hypothetical protein